MIVAVIIYIFFVIISYHYSLTSSHLDVLCSRKHRNLDTLYFSLTHKLIARWQLINAIMELSWAAHSTEPQDLLFYKTNKTQF